MTNARRMRWENRPVLFRAVISRNGRTVNVYGPYQREGDAKAAVTRNTAGWRAAQGMTGRVQVSEVAWKDVDA